MFHKKYLVNCLNKRFQKRLLNLALRCIKIEALSYPSFGLVSRQDSGSHSDMDINTFLISQKTFLFYFKEIGELILHHNKLDFLALRKLGQKQEKRMFKVTNNINTHKGLIFAFGIIYYIVLYGFFHKIPFQNWSFLIKKFVQPLMRDLQNINIDKKIKTNLQKIQFLGARGEALSGYEVVFIKGLPFLQHYQKKYPKLTQEKKILLLLVFYLTQIIDTTLINKIGFQASLAVKKQAQKWLNILDIKGWKHFYKDILNYNNLYKKNNISPGGCADLSVITLFLSYFNN